MDFFSVLVPIIWLNRGWRQGLNLFYALLLSSFINQVLKIWFDSPRPFHLDASLSIIQVSGLGFPRGDAQNTILLPGILIDFQKYPHLRWLVAPYVLLIPFSRIYLGVHFPSDIVGGMDCRFSFGIAIPPGFSLGAREL